MCLNVYVYVCTIYVYVVCICVYGICVYAYMCGWNMCFVWFMSLFLYVYECICILVCLHICVCSLYLYVCVIYVYGYIWCMCICVVSMCVCVFPRQLSNFSKTTFDLFLIFFRLSYTIVTTSLCQILSVIWNSSINLFAFVSKLYNLKCCNFMVVIWVVLPS